MRLVVMDLEFENQPSRHIIQIGAVLVDTRSGSIETIFHENVALPNGVTLTPYIEDLVGVTQEDLNSARNLDRVLVDFWRVVKSHSCDKVASWGQDIQFLRKETDRLNLTLPKGSWEFLDLTHILQLIRESDHLPPKPQLGLLATLSEYGLKFKGRHHNASDDAFNTARLLVRALQWIGEGPY